MSNESTKKATRVDLEAHDKLKDFCERTGRTQVDVLSELTRRYIKPELERLQAEK